MTFGHRYALIGAMTLALSGTAVAKADVIADQGRLKPYAHYLIEEDTTPPFAAGHRCSITGTPRRLAPKLEAVVP